MNNNINTCNNVNFKAKLVTKMKGRHNIMSKVEKEFAKQTNKLNGELFLNRADKSIVGNNKALEFYAEGKSIIVGYDNEISLLGNDLKTKKDVTPEAVKNIAKKLANVFRALISESNFTANTSSLVDNIFSTKNALRKNKSLAAYFDKRGNKDAASTFETLATKNQNRLNKLEKEYSEQKLKFLKNSEQIGADDPILDTWRLIVKEQDYI